MARPIWRCLTTSCLPQVENVFGVNQNGLTPRAYWFQDGATGHRLNAVHDRLQTLRCSLIG